MVSDLFWQFTLVKDLIQGRPCESQLCVVDICHRTERSVPFQDTFREFIRSQKDLIFVFQLRTFLVHVSLDEFHIIFPGSFAVRSEYFHQPVCCEEGGRLLQSGCSPVTAPFPFFGMLYQFCFPGIEYHISAAVEQIAFLLHDIGFIAVLKDVSDPVVLPVEELAVDLIEIFHSFGQVGVRRFDHEVVMVPHETVHMAQPVEPFDGGVKDVEILDPVCLIQEDHLSFITSAYDMVKSTFELDP